jgi:hypothetical protein
LASQARLIVPPVPEVPEELPPPSPPHPPIRRKITRIIMKNISLRFKIKPLTSSVLSDSLINVDFFLA